MLKHTLQLSSPTQFGKCLNEDITLCSLNKNNIFFKFLVSLRPSESSKKISDLKL